MTNLKRTIYLIGGIVNAYAAVRLGKVQPIQSMLHYALMLLLCVFFIMEFSDKTEE